MNLDRRVTKQTHGRQEIYPGEGADVWSDAGTVWAHVREQTGREMIRAGQVDAEQAVVVTVRFNAADEMTTNDRLVYEGQPLHIRSIREVGRRAYREFTCVRVGEGSA